MIYCLSSTQHSPFWRHLKSISHLSSVIPKYCLIYSLEDLNFKYISRNIHDYFGFIINHEDSVLVLQSPKIMRESSLCSFCCLLIIKLATHQRQLCPGISDKGQVHPAMLLLLCSCCWSATQQKPYEIPMLAASPLFDIWEAILPLKLL